MYKIKLCEDYETANICPRGNECNFAHGKKELRGQCRNLAKCEALF